MDLNTVTSYRAARSREDLRLAPGERILGGGTWLFSEPQVTTTGFVDLTSMGWPRSSTPRAAACGSAPPARSPSSSKLPERATGLDARHPIFFQAATALLASFKIWNVATVGGNICQSFSAAIDDVALAAASTATALDLDARRRRAPQCPSPT